MAAPRKEAVANAITSDTVFIADLALLHHLGAVENQYSCNNRWLERNIHPSNTTAELESTPSHAIGVEALIALQSWISHAVGGLAVDKAGAEGSLQACMKSVGKYLGILAGDKAYTSYRRPRNSRIAHVASLTRYLAACCSLAEQECLVARRLAVGAVVGRKRLCSFRWSP